LVENVVVTFSWLLEERQTNIRCLFVCWKFQSYLKDDTRFFEKINFDISTSDFTSWTEVNTNKFTLDKKNYFNRSKAIFSYNLHVKVNVNVLNEHKCENVQKKHMCM